MTTENLPAIPEAREIARADTDSWVHVIADVSKFATIVAPTDFVPDAFRDSPAAVTAAIIYGREVGLPPMTALTQVHLVKGKPGLYAEAMRALVYAAGHELEVVESTTARCVMRGRRRGTERWSAPVEWTIDNARAAGLLSNQNYTKYPRQMLLARCSVELIRRDFPDVIHGFNGVEEFEGDDVPEAPQAATTRVSRTGKRAAKKTTHAPVEARERPAIAGPPLPGEEGYEPASAPSNVGGSAVSELPAESTGGADVSDTPGEATPEDEAVESSTPSPGDQTDEAGGDAEREAAEPPASEDDTPTPIRGPRKASAAQKRMIFGLLGPLEVTTDDDRHDAATAIVGHRIESFSDLTSDNAKTIIDTLGRVTTREELDAILAAAAGGES